MRRLIAIVPMLMMAGCSFRFDQSEVNRRVTMQALNIREASKAQMDGAPVGPTSKAINKAAIAIIEVIGLEVEP